MITFLAGCADLFPGLMAFANSFDSDHTIAIQREDDKVTVVVHHVHPSAVSINVQGGGHCYGNFGLVDQG